MRDSLQTATLEVKQADSDLRNAKEMLAIQENQNAADLQAAQVELDLARLALQQFEDGTYPQELADAETLVKMTEITVRNKEEDLEQTKALFAKGFVTAADVKQAELSVIGANYLRRTTAYRVETAPTGAGPFTEVPGGTVAQKTQSIQPARCTIALAAGSKPASDC